MKLLLGSNNQHKAKEIKNILKSTGVDNIELLTLGEVFNEVFDVVEDGVTFEENAFKKADEYAKASSLPCIADDTGLEIDALNGEPGVYSARYSGVHGDDAANRAKVLEELKDLPDENRTARFRTVICYKNNNLTEYIIGICEGKIAFEESGNNGFGYDSIFIPEGSEVTFAQMSANEKDAISHRGKATREFAEFIRNKK